MSYSFAVRSPHHAGVKQAISDQFNKVVQGQPVHAKDRGEAQKGVFAMIDVCREPKEDEHYYVRVNGSMSWDGSSKSDASDAELPIKGSNLSVSVSLIPAEAPAKDFPISAP
jgi:hypothetical protein